MIARYFKRMASIAALFLRLAPLSAMAEDSVSLVQSVVAVSATTDTLWLEQIAGAFRSLFSSKPLAPSAQ